MTRLRWAALGAVVLLLALAASAAAADVYPSKPIRLIVPFPPGGSNDIVARMIGAQLGERLGKQVVIDNRGSAILASADTQKRFLDEGAEVVQMRPAEFGAFIAAETAKWTRVVREAGIRAE